MKVAAGGFSPPTKVLSSQSSSILLHGIESSGEGQDLIYEPKKILYVI